MKGHQNDPQTPRILLHRDRALWFWNSWISPWCCQASLQTLHSMAASLTFLYSERTRFIVTHTSISDTNDQLLWKICNTIEYSVYRLHGDYNRQVVLFICCISVCLLIVTLINSFNPAVQSLKSEIKRGKPSPEAIWM